MRFGGMGDVLLAGPCVRAVSRHAEVVVLLVDRRGRAAAELLPGVDDVIEWQGGAGHDTADALTKVRAGGFDQALLLTRPAESALPAEPESERLLSLSRAVGFSLPATDDHRLAVRLPRAVDPGLGPPDYVVVHPGAGAFARRPSIARWSAIVRLLDLEGYRVVVTGSPAERDLTTWVAGDRAMNLGGRTTLPELTAVLAGAGALIAPNTGPAHLAAAVGTPVVSIFAPTEPAARWAPFGVATAVLGDQQAPCRDSHARICPVDGHPCLESVTPHDVLNAVQRVAPGLHRRPPLVTPPPIVRPRAPVCGITTRGGKVRLAAPARAEPLRLRDVCPAAAGGNPR